MLLRYLYLRNFRNHKDISVDFGPRVNNIYGPNAQGKTNLLEAIYFLLTGRSFRKHSIFNLIRHGADSFYIEAHFIKRNVEQKLSIVTNGKGKRVTYNNNLYSSLTNLLGILQGVILTPEDGNLINGSPAIRRRYLDIQIAQADPLYVHHLNRYLRAMKCRNVLLRKKSLKSIESWEYEMARSAKYIVASRFRAIEDLVKKSVEILRNLSLSGDRMSLCYKTSASMKDLEGDLLLEHYLKQYQSWRSREIGLGYTLVGPHRDDMSIAICDKEAFLYASEGQKFCCSMALRLAEWERLRDLVEDLPIMAIDDIGNSLDNFRKKSIEKYLSYLGQVFITSTEKLFVENSLFISIN